MLSTFLGVIVRIFTNSFTNAFQKKMVKENSSIVISFITFLLLSVFCIYPATQVNWTLLDISFWLYVIIANILCVLSTICIIKALQTGELTILSSINSYKCVVALIFATVFLHEVPNIFGLAGLMLVVFGSKIIFNTTDEGFSVEFLKRKDVLLRIAAMVLFGIEAVFLKKIIMLSSFKISFILWCFGGTLFSLPFVVASARKIDITKLKTNSFNFLILALSTGLMQLSTNFVFEHLNVSLALALFQLSTVVNLFLGFKMFAEKDILKKSVGIIIMLIGSTLILILNP